MSKKITNKCLIDFKNEGKIDEELQKAIINKANKIANSRSKGKFTKKNAIDDPKIIDEAVNLIIAEKQYEKFVEALDIEKKSKIINEFKETLKMNPGRPDLAAAAFFANVDGFRKTASIGIESKTLSFQKTYWSNNNELAVLMSKKYFNNDQNSLKFLREMFNQGKTGDSDITPIAKKVKETFNLMADDLIERGAKLNKTENYFPQTHDSLKLKAVKKEEWLNFVKNKLDFEKMTDNEGNYIPEKSRDRILNEVFDTIVTKGLNKVEEPKIKNGKVEGIQGQQKASLREKYAEEKFLIFKDADAQFAYHDKFGKGNLGDVIANHISSASNDVAVLDVLGPKTSSSIDMLKTFMTVNNAKRKDILFIDKLHKEVVNDARAIADPFTASIFTAFRTLGILPNIGSVMLSALADLGNGSIAPNKYGFVSKFGTSNRMFTRPTAVAKMIYQQFKNPEELVRLNGNIKYMLYQNERVDRMGNEMANPDLVKYADSKSSKIAAAASDKLATGANFMYKLSLLTDWTEAGKNIAIREIMDQMASIRHKSYDELEDRFKVAMQTAGINKDLFNKIKKADTEKYEGNDTFTIDSIFATKGLTKKEKQEIFMSLDSFGQSYAKESVPEAGAYITAKTNTNGDAGNIGHEIVKTLMQFKRFPVTYFHNQLMGDWKASNGKLGDFFGQIALRTTYGMSLGVLAVQLSELSNGRTPKDIDLKLALEGIFKAGGAGIASDILFKDFSGRNRDVLDYAAGPSGSTFVNLVRGKSKITNTIMEGFGYEIDKYQDSYDLDAGSAVDVLDGLLDYGNLWYTKEIIDMGVDQLLRSEFDDDYKKDVRKEEKKLRENNQTKWSNDLFD